MELPVSQLIKQAQANNKYLAPIVFLGILLMTVIVVVIVTSKTTFDTEKEEPLIEYYKGQVLIDDGTNSSIPKDEILSGGPSKDGIPALTLPDFVEPKVAEEYLSEDSLGISLTIDNDSRFYPYSILVWHELVNDKVGEQRVLVTYCPLCATGVVFDREVNGEVLEFGVSGLLWQSNVLMYNRVVDKEHESLWSQILGKGVTGEFTDVQLDIVKSDILTFSEWKQAHLEGKVLSKETGFFRSYGSDPYGDYYTNSEVGYGAVYSDTRLEPKSYILGIEINDSYKAYELEKMPNDSDIIDDFDGNTIKISKNEFSEITISVNEDKEKVLEYIGSFWFSWVAVHPETDLYIYQ